MHSINNLYVSFYFVFLPKAHPESSPSTYRWRFENNKFYTWTIQHPPYKSMKIAKYDYIDEMIYLGGS